MDINSPICRVCMQHAMELIDFEGEIEDSSTLTVLDSFNFCTQLSATKDDELPKHLCTSCGDELRNAFNFVRKAQEADTALRQKIKEEISQETAYVIVQTEDNYDGELLPVKEGDLKGDNDDVIDILYTIEDVELSNEDKTLERIPTFCIERLEHGEVLPDDNPEGGDKTRDSIPRFSCSQCSKLLVSQADLERHLKTVHVENKLLCNICGKTCSSRNTLNTHLNQHKGKTPFSCQQCNKTYFTKNGLQLHISAMHSETKRDKFLCSICGKGFATKQRLEIHHLSHTGEKNYDCYLCEKKFATSFRLRAHLRIHAGEKPYQCQTCGMRFTQRNALRCHERIHTGEKPFECKVCGKRFNQGTILKTHMTLHTGKTVKCPQCDKKFSRPSCLILHQREHTGEKPYVCYKCPKAYKQKSHLDRHLDTHFGVKHKCDICDKEYSKRSSLKIHMFEHTDDKPFQCLDCMEKFARRDKYKAHLKKAHNKILVKNEVKEVVKLDNCTEAVISNNKEIIVEIQDIIGDDNSNVSDTINYKTIRIE